MRTHSEIVRQFGARALREALAGRGAIFSANATQLWAHRNSIPARYWPLLCDLGAAKMEELMARTSDGHPSVPAPKHRPALTAGVQEPSRPFVRDFSEEEPNEARDWAKRRAALESFYALARGWRSEEPYGPRDELHDR